MGKANERKSDFEERQELLGRLDVISKRPPCSEEVPAHLLLVARGLHEQQLQAIDLRIKYYADVLCAYLNNQFAKGNSIDFVDVKSTGSTEVRLLCVCTGDIRAIKALIEIYKIGRMSILEEKPAYKTILLSVDRTLLESILSVQSNLVEVGKIIEENRGRFGKVLPGFQKP